MAAGPSRAADVAAMREALQLLVDEQACARVIQNFGIFADGDDADAFVDLFAPDATWQRAGGPTYQGHAAIREIYAARPEGTFSRHLICNIAVTLAGEEATVTSNAVVLKSPDGRQPCQTAPAVLMGGYVDRLKRCGDGEWRIVERSSTMLLNLAPAAPA